MNTPVNSGDIGKTKRSGPSWLHLFVIVVAAVALTAGATYWLLSRYLFVSEFRPVRLQPAEEQVLNGKLRAVGIDVQPSDAADAPLEPERYSEAGAAREVEFSQRELNGMLAKNTDLAHRLAIDLSDDLVSVKLLIPLQEDFPVLGGRTLRVNAGVTMAYADNRPVISLKGVSVMGVPLPNAWLGNLKNIDLVDAFGGDRGFWKNLADGVESIRVSDGRLLIQLKE